MGQTIFFTESFPYQSTFATPETEQANNIVPSFYFFQCSPNTQPEEQAIAFTFLSTAKTFHLYSIPYIFTCRKGILKTEHDNIKPGKIFFQHFYKNLLCRQAGAVILICREARRKD